MTKGSYTNFQDQDMIVSARDTGKEIFSVRFIYGSNAVDWPSRCPTIKKWFFQCLKSMSEIFDELVVDERSRFDRFRKQLKGVDSDSDDHNIDRVETEERGKIRGRQNLEAMEHPVGLLYWNTGLWDWRTGRSAEEFKNDMIELLKRAQVNRGAFSPGFAKRVVWRSTSASWPSKFITGKECKNKPHDADDSRPCSVHTDGIMQYNSIASRLVEFAGMETVDSWPITNGRPDLSFDGLHFEHYQETMHASQKDVNEIYYLLNDMFLNTVCYK